MSKYIKYYNVETESFSPMIQRYIIYYSENNIIAYIKTANLAPTKIIRKNNSITIHNCNINTVNMDITNIKFKKINIKTFINYIFN